MGTDSPSLGRQLRQTPGPTVVDQNAVVRRMAVAADLITAHGRGSQQRPNTEGAEGGQ